MISVIPGDWISVAIVFIVRDVAAYDCQVRPAN